MFLFVGFIVTILSDSSCLTLSRIAIGTAVILKYRYFYFNTNNNFANIKMY